MDFILKLSLINCGYITEHLAKINLKVSKKSLSNLVKENQLNKSKHMLFGKITDIYTLSDISLKKVRNEGYYIYKHDSSQLEHDYLLNKVFLSLSNEEKVTWKNETELKNKFGKSKNTSDAIFRKGNKIIGVEILTSSYKKNNIKEKMDFLSNICDEHILLNTNDFKWR